MDDLVPWPRLSILEEEVAERHLLEVVQLLALQHFPGGEGHLPQEEHQHIHKTHGGRAFARHVQSAVQSQEERVPEVHLVPTSGQVMFELLLAVAASPLSRPPCSSSLAMTRSCHRQMPLNLEV